ncbi:ImmA/IrrE family metallo-endopeptidase [Nocardiopsis dassonvillei]|uniref:ImmA/IrrE family metallo-endopeptidase n=1 Tax=Nocardiopsis dassonvillei TaxID=2014 RepID=UPI003F55BB10
MKYTKAYAARVAEEERTELGYSPFEAMDPHRLADNYGIRVLTLADLAGDEETLAAATTHFTLTRPDVFSGALLPLSTGHVIVVNQAHSPERQRSTLAHELAHVLLEHEFTTTLHLTGKCRMSDQDQEKQANDLGGELLIPRQAAFRAARAGHSDEQVAFAFKVSVPFARWRMNASGARRVADRARAKAERV